MNHSQFPDVVPMRQGGLMSDPQVLLVPWSDADLELLRRINTPEMKRHLGGPETEEKVLARHQRYLKLDSGQMFRVALLPEGQAVGSIGYWDRVWDGDTAYEAGWHVLPEFQGRGIAGTAVREIIAATRADGKHRWLRAFPDVENPASNAICRKAGFEFVGETDFEFPAGRIMRSNHWRCDLEAA
jgi:RimJ/RimL family protein N-acetyltransferase